MLRCEFRIGSKRLPSSSLFAMTWPANTRPDALLQPALPQVTVTLTVRLKKERNCGNTLDMQQRTTGLQSGLTQVILPLTQDSRTLVLQKKSERFSSFSLVFSIFSWEVESVKECLNAWSLWLFSEWTQDMFFFPEKLSFKIFPEESARHPLVPAGICWNKMYRKMKFHKRKSLIPTSPSIARSVYDIPPPLISVHLHELLNGFHGHVVSWSRRWYGQGPMLFIKMTWATRSANWLILIYGCFMGYLESF